MSTPLNADGSGGAVEIAFTRFPNGDVDRVLVSGSALRNTSAEQRDTLDSFAQQVARSLALKRQIVRSGGAFVVAAPLQGFGIDISSMPCAVLGEGLVAGRRVVVGSCQGTAPAVLLVGPEQRRMNGRAAISMLVAVDVRSGVLVSSVTDAHMTMMDDRAGVPQPHTFALFTETRVR